MRMKDTGPQERERQRVESVKIQQKTTHFAGPLPPPESLAQYDKIVPGAAERIIAMAEKEMEHRHKNEDKTTKSIIVTTVISIVFAFISVLVLCAIVIYALYRGFGSVAGIIATGAIAAVAGVFIGKSRKSK